MKLLLLTPPMVQINTPYPATAYLKGFLRERHPEVEVSQADIGLELFLKLFSARGLERMIPLLAPQMNKLKYFKKFQREYSKVIDPTIAFLQGKNPSLAEKILAGEYLPEGPRFHPLRTTGQLQDAFMELPEQDQAKHLASLFVDDLADIVRTGIDERFELVRYGERLAASQYSFDSLYKHLTKSRTLLDEMLEEITEKVLREEKPDVIGISVPFSGTVYGALRIGSIAKEKKIPVLLGGGYVNTELRELTDARLFEFVDFISLDDGERPLECLLEHLQGTRPKENLLRTFALDAEKKVHFYSSDKEHDIPFKESGTPTYLGLPMEKYVSMLEMLNPVNRLWSEARWNKLTLAHGCYWRRCSFCDTSLDYIRRFEHEKAERLVDKMIQLQKETGINSFHFVDEAAPPATLSAMADVILERNLSFHWFGNIRFDKNFTTELTKKLAAAGCIAVTGGLEVASPRILELIEKGVSIEQVAKVTKAFQEAGIFVHAYLMFGFPTQTLQETVDSLEVVRQLFEENCLSSAFWHRFAATAHSPVGKNPAKYGITILPPKKVSSHGVFAVNDVLFEDKKGFNHDLVAEPLRTALYNYMHGVGIEFDVRDWFPERVPKPKIPATFIHDSL